MLAHVEALIRCVDDDRVLHKSVLLKVVDKTPHLVVHRAYAAQVVAHVSLVFPLRQLPAREVGLDEGFVLGSVGCLPCLLLFGCQARCGGAPVAVGLGNVRRTILKLRDLEVVDKLHILLDAHLLVMGRRAALGVVVIEVIGHGELHIFVEVVIFGFGHPVAVRRLVVYEQAEGFALVAPLEELYGVVGDERRRVALLANIFAVRLR